MLPPEPYGFGNENAWGVFLWIIFSLKKKKQSRAEKICPKKGWKKCCKNFGQKKNNCFGKFVSGMMMKGMFTITFQLLFGFFGEGKIYPPWNEQQVRPFFMGRDPNRKVYTDWWFQRFFIFIPIWENDPFWNFDYYFSKGLKPPPSIVFQPSIFRCHVSFRECIFYPLNKWKKNKRALKIPISATVPWG